jgi:transcriptional regulator with XRE-family HTH domain
MEERTEMKALLSQRGISQWEVAAAMGMNPGVLNGILNGSRLAPQGFEERFQAAVQTATEAKVARLRGETVSAR